MINKLMQIIAPHYCYGCGKVGVPLCADCKYDIVDEAFDSCLVCACPTPAGICTEHATTYDRAWCVGERSGVLERLIDALKFERVQDAAGPLASLLGDILPVLPATAVVVPVPTIPSHVRQRGYDHTRLMARCLARGRSVRYDDLLARKDSSVQRGRSKKERFEQARDTFYCTRPADSAAVYILIDDVVTTNATVRFAAAELRRAGAGAVWVAVLARQALDK